MTHGHFGRYALRTLDADAARAFYEAVLGHHGDVVFPLHEQAIARGARPHWLGHIDVADPRAVAAPLLAAGGIQYGERPDGVIVLRDPGGALVALGGVVGPSRAGVAWQVLRVNDADRVVALYAESLGWTLGEHFVVSPNEAYHTLCYGDGSVFGAVGGLSEGVHPQWLFFFEVDSLERAIARVDALGGSVVAEVTREESGTKRRYVVCDDPQGAAFGLVQR